MRINLYRRLAALEKDRSCDELIVLRMPDGRTATLPGHNEYVIDLLGRAVRGDRTPEMDLVARSVSSTEPGDAHMIDLVRALLNGPTEAATGSR
jgi:hypothetical protein